MNSDKGELESSATCKEYLQVRPEGTRRVSRSRNDKDTYPTIKLRHCLQVREDGSEMGLKS